MKIIDKNYPYPVLIENSDDYIDSNFEISVIDGPKEIDGEIVVEIRYILSSKGLLEMVNADEAKVVIQVTCPTTSYRNAFLFDGDILRIAIPKNFLGSKVEFSSFVVSNVARKFELKEHNKTYFSIPSQIKKGDRLAIGDIVSFKIESYDALRPIASIITIKENKIKNAEAINVDFSCDKIVIYMNTELFDKYKQLREYPNLRLYLSTNIVMPTIIEALAEMKNKNSMEPEKRWEINIRKILKTMKIDLQKTELSLYSIANKIFKNGLLTSMKSLELFFNIGELENET